MKAYRVLDLPRAGGAGDQDDAVRQVHELGDDREHALGEAHLVDAGHLGVGIDDADHHLLEHAAGAQEDREGGEAEVDLLAAVLDMGAAVQGAALLGDVHAPEHLEAGDDLHHEAARDGILLRQVAVDAVADAHAPFLGLQVDVGGAQADGFAHDQVHDLDDLAAFLVADRLVLLLLLLAVEDQVVVLVLPMRSLSFSLPPV